MKKLQELYSGKAKTLYLTDDNEHLVMLFRDDTSAFDGEKTEKLSGKGAVNNLFNAHVMQLLENQGVPTGFVKPLSDKESLVKKLDMLPVECVVRNYTAGSIVRRYGVDSNMKLSHPLFEFFLKDDARHDPLINDEHITTFGWANTFEIAKMREYTLKANQILSDFFSKRGLILVDFKLEFGRFNDSLYLGDEFTPDGCRIWDEKTKESYDKDRFRQGLGDVVSSYTTAAKRLGINLNSNILS